MFYKKVDFGRIGKEKGKRKARWYHAERERLVYSKLIMRML